MSSRSMYSGVAGLKAQQTKLDVIGNNIANISTNGYKSQRVTFSDVLSQTISAATGTSSTKGGTNPEQIGLGVAVASTDTNMTTGSTESTGNSQDVSISGNGFFIVQGGSTGEYQFTRAGNFGVDSAGNLTVNGYEVCGWEQYATTTTDGTTTYKYNTQTDVAPINLFVDDVNGNKKIISPKATSALALTGTLNPTATAKGTALDNIGTIPTTADATTTMTVYDAEGNSYDLQVKLSKCYTDASTASTTTGSVDVSSGATITTGTNDELTVSADGTSGTITIAAGTYTSASALLTAVKAAISSNTTMNGKVTAALDSTGKYIVFTSATKGSSSSVSVTGGDAQSTVFGTGTNTAGVTNTDNTSWFWQAVSSDSNLSVASPSSGYIEFTSSGTIVKDNTSYPTSTAITLTPATSVGSAAFTATLDLSNLTSYTTTSTTSSVTATADGYAAGELQDFSIGSDGIITGTYSNGQKQPLAMLALTTFTNNAGLEKIGENLYSTTVNSGSYTGGVTAGSGGTGSLSSGTLEGSNVDLAEQFSDMMITERAYQANSKIITTSDTMMETLINMIR